MKEIDKISSFRTDAKILPAIGQSCHLGQENKLGKSKYRSKEFIEILCDILDSMQKPFLVLDHNLNVSKANLYFCDTFNINDEEIVNKSILYFEKLNFATSKIRELIEKTIFFNLEINDLHIKIDDSSSSLNKLHITAYRLPYKNSKKSHLILLVFKDVTDSKCHQNDHVKVIENLKLDLISTKNEVEIRKQLAEQALSKIKILEKQLEKERAYLKEDIELACNHGKIVGKSDSLKYVLYKVEQIAGSDTTVLILGETGTGKDLAARAIHQLSQRKNRSLVKVNCAALPANLIESELFGHERGAFTDSHAKHIGRFEVANGGTFFLDEIGELPLELQGKLLRVLQDGEFERLGSTRTIKVDTRIIAATNRNLEEEVRKGRFREDLWYRLNIFPITMPPLRDRQDDIPMLVEFYVKKITERMGKKIDVIPGRVMDILQQYHWPGNVRELQNVLERAVINSSGPKLHLADELKNPSKDSSIGSKTLAAIERDYILHVLKQTKWKVSGKNSAAEILGLDRSTLRARISKLGIER